MNSSLRYGWVWVLPALVLFFLFTFYPFVRVFWLSLFTVDLFWNTTFIGLKNFVTVFTAPRFLRTLGITALFTLLGAPLVVGISLAVASLAHRLGKHTQTLIRFFYYVPILISGAIISLVWSWLFAVDGPLNGLLGLHVPWLSKHPYAFIACLIVLITSLIGDTFIILLATMNGFNRHYYEASALDGCSNRQQFRYITLPLIWPVAGLMLLLKVIGISQIWQIPWVLTGGGPYYHTSTLVLSIFQTGVLNSKYGLASAQSAVLVLFIGGLAILQKTIERRIQK